MDNLTIDAIILAGGGMDESLRDSSDAPNKAFIDVAGKPMVQYVIEAAKGVPEIGRIVLGAEEKHIPSSLKDMVDLIAPPGATILKSLLSAMGVLNPKPHMVLVMPCDLALLTPEALRDFINKSLDSKADITYGYLSKKDSEDRFPDVNHTYVRIDGDYYCGTGLFMMSPDAADRFEHFFNSLTGNRKNPIALAGVLGIGFIIKYVMGNLKVKDAEERVKVLMGGTIGKGIQTFFPEAAFNVDAPNELLIARRILGEKSIRV